MSIRLNSFTGSRFGISQAEIEEPGDQAPRQFAQLARCLICLLVVAILAIAGGAATPPVARFTLRADRFDRGNVQVCLPGQNYADRYLCLWNPANLHSQWEYDIDFPVSADYTLVALYTAGESRPVDIYFDGKKVHRGFAGVTGNWMTSQARWEEQCALRIVAGKHTLKLLCSGSYMPHICALRFESPIAFPKGWKLQAALNGSEAELYATPSEPPQIDEARMSEALRLYVKKATWQETMLASREALMRQARASGKGGMLPNFGASHFTVMAWVRTTQGGTILSKSPAKGVWGQPGGKAFFVGDGRLGFDAIGIGTFAAGTNIADGQWHHVAITWRTAMGNPFYDFLHNLEFYVDGELDRAWRLIDKSSPDASGDRVRIGLSAPNFRSPNGFKGQIDEVRVYDRNLTPLEIKACQEGRLPNPQADCVGYWSLDVDASDHSGNGNHGVIRGATVVEGKVGKALQFDGQGSVEVEVEEGWQLRQALWKLVQDDFTDAPSRTQIAWEREERIWNTVWSPGDLTVLAKRYAGACSHPPFLREHAGKRALTVTDVAGLQRVRELYYLFKRLDEARSPLLSINFRALRLAIEDLTRTFGDNYPKGKHYLARLDACEQESPRLLDRLARGDGQTVQEAGELVSLCQEILLANPLLDFDRLLLVNHDGKDTEFRRGYEQSNGLPMNYEGNSSLRKTGYDNEIAILSPVRSDGKLTPLFRPDGGRFLGDLDLHFDADRMLFSMPGANGRWQVFELHPDGTGLRQLPLIEQPDVDNYDACYLPDGDVLFTSTACFTGVPCVGGAHHVANLYRLDTSTGQIRRLTFEQDHDWCPTLLNDGRVLYLRWEYSDIPHLFSRILFHMNPDGTGQMEYYGSNSYWPNAMFFARPVPNHPTKFVAVIGGHHGAPRMGELVLFDRAKGRQEADGVVQRIPGYGKKVEPIILDTLVEQSWPKFLHPYPLSEKYFIVSAKLDPKSKWGIYLVDVFDNMLLLKEVKDRALLEPVPLRQSVKPPIIPSKVEPERPDATVYLADVYRGDGLKDVPRGTVKKLRLLTYHFAYQGMGGQQNRVGLDGPWDIKRVLGTVPVEADGSAMFRVPANTPISLQPLDAEGKSLQLMRSWMTAMPGEVISCAGCHERQNTAPPVIGTLASRRAPSEIAPWHGPTRGFSFVREVQPVLDQYCVGCHNGQSRADGQTLPDLTPKPDIVQLGTSYTPSYWVLRRFVRTTTMENDMHLLSPCDYHADTTPLIQMLLKGHHNVELDPEAWDRLITWIDLHAPAHGTWHELLGRPVTDMRDRRRAMMKLYAAGPDEDPEAISDRPGQAIKPVLPASRSESSRAYPVCRGWPFDAAAAKRRQAATQRHEWTIDLGDGVKLELVLIPDGEFVIGDPNGQPDERPLTRVKINRPFWIGKFEITNEQFRRFAPLHDSRFEPGDFIQLGIKERGFSVNLVRQPVVRVSWNQAVAFCRWLSERTGQTFALPSEAQWEYACRAGTATPLWYGFPDVDFAPFANLADSSLKYMESFDFGFPASCVPPWRPAIDSVNDKHRVSAPVGMYQPNPWGLCDMHGNVWEWTQTTYKPYPYHEDDGRNNGAELGKKVVRGGSWYDRPKHCRSAFRLSYPPWQSVYNVGFRVICPVESRVANR